jgi:hypothetical protein
MKDLVVNQAIINFATTLRERDQNIYRLCKYCGSEINTSVRGWQNANDAGWKNVIECKNRFCPKVKSESKYSVELKEDEVKIVQFETFEEATEYFQNIRINVLIQRIKSGEYNSKRIKKRKGKNQYFCKLCDCDIVPGTYVYSYFLDTSITGRRYPITHYICEKCWIEKIEGD